MDELARIINLLKSKLPDYLRKKGLNPDAGFNCLNPSHKEHMPSMSYSASTQTVDCFSCNASYDIFALIGIDFNLSSFKAQFIKAHEMFIGEVPYSLLSALNEQYSENKDPHFEIASDYPDKYKNDFINESAKQNQDIGDTFSIYTDKFQNSNPTGGLTIGGNRSNDSFPPKGLNFSQPRGGGVVFNANTRNPAFNPSLQRNPGQHLSQQSPNNINFSIGSNTFDSGFREELKNDYSEYFRQCSQEIKETDFYEYHCISDETVKRFKLGCDPHFMAGVDQIGGQIIWKAAIIPLGTSSYAVYNTARPENSRVIRKGPYEIFNAQALNYERDLFITFDELDALSLESLGHSAIAIGDPRNLPVLLETLRQKKNENRCYYICRNNETREKDIANQLGNYLVSLNNPYRIINLALPYKSINEALCKTPETLRYRLDNFNDLVTFSPEGIIRKTEDIKFIEDSVSLTKLELSGNLYTFSGQAPLLHRLVSDIISSNECSILYAGNRVQWKNICQFVSSDRTFGYGDKSAKFISIDGEHIQDQLMKNLSALLMLVESSFVTIVDLSACLPQTALSTLEALADLSEKMKLPIVALCNQKVRYFAESLAVQQLEFSYANDAEIEVDTLSAGGKPLSFIKYQGI